MSSATDPPTAPAIEVEDLVKTYGEIEAVRGVSLTVAPGEVFGFLGPNGAGKSTDVGSHFQSIEGVFRSTHAKSCVAATSHIIGLHPS